MAENLLEEKIEFVTASAGTGKTYRLVETVFDAVMDGSARPEGIVATTFTESAAAELRERLEIRFYGAQRHREVIRLREGYVGTVHSVCLEFLKRFAFEAGLPPEVGVLDENEGIHLLNQAMDEVLGSQSTVELMELARRIGQYDAWKDSYFYQDTIGSLVGAARANDIALERLVEMAAASWSEMQSLLDPPVDVDLDAGLASAIDAALRDMPEVPGTKGSQDYRRFLVGVRKQLDSGLPWSQWLKLSTETPKKAEIDASDPVRIAASRFEEHPQFHADLETYLVTVFDIAARVGDRFQALKRERGVVDFQDIEKEMLDLLRTSETCRETLSEEIDLLVVDEFQDTSPIQLALFSELGKCAKRIVWVGDVKQSIYEFRDADPQLIMDAVAGAKKLAPLDTSWRSTPDLVKFANALFAAPFKNRIDLPEDETIIQAHRALSSEAPASVEIARISSGLFNKGNGKPKALTNARKPEVFADLVEDILNRAEPITVKSSVSKENPLGKTRALRTGDLAILVRSHKQAQAIAGALNGRGIEVAIASAGLLSTPECRLAMACFRRLLDPRDSLATAEIIAFENEHPTEEWIEQRIRFVREAEEKGEDPSRWGLEGDLVSPALVWLEESREEEPIDLLSPLRLFDLACVAADASRIVARWGATTEHFRQREANLEQLRRLFCDYQDRCANLGIPATTMGLLAYLAEVEKRGEDQQALDPGADAVHVSTYHGAKGLEWPVVIVADLDSEIRSRLYSLRSVNLASDKKIQLSDPLADRGLRLWLNPFGKSGSDTLDKMEDSETGRDSLRRAEDEELRLLYVGITRARDRIVLPLETGMEHPWLNLVGAPADALLGLEESGVVSFDGSNSLSVRVADFLWKEPPPLPEPASEIDFPIRADQRTEKLLASLVPSGQPAIPGASIGEIIEFGERLAWKGNPDPGTVGDVMHRIFAVEILNPESDEGVRLQRISDLLAGYDLESHLEPSTVAATVDRYRAFVKEQFSPISEQVEVPFSYLNESGQRVSGFIDHLLETEAGPVILDHKIFPGKREDWEAKALSYSGQLQTYAEAVGSAGHPVTTRIHLVTAGAILEVQP
ncbi:MAG: UvrD-helicase domain-containing protein [Verrucomicrobiales bacterium]|nr:UvrD-helicase domain-containing protein [Verrucomicrobiales bacterium]